MATAQDLINWAKSQIGYTESPAGSNRQKYSTQLGVINGVPWCDIFISAGFQAIGMRPIEGVHTGTVEHRASYMHRGRLYYGTPQPGDIAFYHFGGTAVVDHAEIVVEYHWSLFGSYIITVGGNTSSSSSGSQSNGGGVYLKSRKMSLTRGFGRPAYSNAPVTPPLPPIQPPYKLQGTLEGKTVTVTPFRIKTDGNGNGWGDSNIPFAKVFNVAVNPANPPVNGYPPMGDCSWQNANEQARIVLERVGVNQEIDIRIYSTD